VPDWMPHTSIRWAEDQLISGSDTVTLTLEPFRDALTQDGHDNVHHVPHGTPCIHPSDDPQDILAAGYWGQDKALGTVLRKAPDLSDRLTVIGGRHPEYPDHLEELRSDHPAVTFTGRVDESRFRNAFAEARYALLTNRSPKGTSGILNYAAAGGTAPIILEDSGMEAVAAAEGYDTITVPEQDLNDLGRILKDAPTDEIARQNRATAQEKTFDTAFTALQELLKDKMELLDIDPSFATRYLNEGFSGGEKKRAEILQMAVLEPEFAILDETDSGLDIDALKIVSDGIKTVRDEQDDMCILMITHYQRILDYVEPDRIHVMMDGQIVTRGDAELAQDLEDRGYDWIREEFAA